MTRKSEFHAVDFFRKVRDEQAASLAAKSPAEIVAFFAQRKLASKKPAVGARRAGTRA